SGRRMHRTPLSLPVAAAMRNASNRRMPDVTDTAPSVRELPRSVEWALLPAMRCRIVRLLAALLFSAVAIFPRAALCVGDAGHVAIELGDDSCCPAERSSSAAGIVAPDTEACPTHCRDTLMGVG